MDDSYQTLKVGHEVVKQDFSNEELREIIKDLLDFIEVPDEPRFQTAMYIPYETQLMNAAQKVIKLKQVVAKARMVK
jgi:hypothetical protein